MTDWVAVCTECGKLGDGYEEHVPAADDAIQHRREYLHDANVLATSEVSG